MEFEKKEKKGLGLPERARIDPEGSADGESVAIAPFYRVGADGTLTYLAMRKGVSEEVSVGLEDMHVGIQKGGNVKTGAEWLLNTLPGENPITIAGDPITNMRGSCVGCCDGCEGFCYAIKGARTHHNAVMPSTIKNLLIYRRDPKRFEDEIDSELTAWESAKRASGDRVFRWHASGEIEDYPYLEMMMRIAERHPTVRFYGYTKRFGYVERYLKEHGDFPANFVMNLSVWEDNLERSGFDMSLIGKVQRFEWRDEMSVADYGKAIHCRSVVHDKEGERKGHLDHSMNCRKCGLCWRGLCKGRTIVVYNH